MESYEMLKTYKVKETRKRIKRAERSLFMISKMDRLKRFDPYLYDYVVKKRYDSLLLGVFCGVIFGICLTLMLV